MTEQTVHRWLRAGRLRGTLLNARAGWRIPKSSVDDLLMSGSAAEPMGEMLDRGYELMCVTGLRTLFIAMLTAVDGSIYTGSTERVIRLKAAGVKLSDLPEQRRLFDYQRNNPRWTALRRSVNEIDEERVQRFIENGAG